jgi:hypothetical protein
MPAWRKKFNQFWWRKDGVRKPGIKWSSRVRTACICVHIWFMKYFYTDDLLWYSHAFCEVENKVCLALCDKEQFFSLISNWRWMSGNKGCDLLNSPVGDGVKARAITPVSFLHLPTTANWAGCWVILFKWTSTHRSEHGNAKLSLPDSLITLLQCI